MKITLLSAGAAQGLVAALAEDLAAAGLEVAGSFGAVGAIRDRILAGEAFDVVIVSSNVIEELEASGHIVSGLVHEIGSVPTGIGVREGDPVPDCSDPARFKAALEAAEAIFLPDPEKATAGIHLVKTMRELGVADDVFGRMRAYPNGHAAMTAMAVTCDVRRVIGCTQATEIIAAPGIGYVGPLPKACGLSTGYSAGVSVRVVDRNAAGQLVAMITDPGKRALREGLGFAVV